eukprot:1160436-Pelagomonas_calceolata.AAC.22
MPQLAQILVASLPNSVHNNCHTGIRFQSAILFRRSMETHGQSTMLRTETDGESPALCRD